MRLRLLSLVALFSIVSVGLSAAQSTATQTETQTVTVTGEIVSYTPGRTIVIRDPSQKTVTFTLSPSVNVPQDVRVGQTVTLFTDTDSSGVAIVKKVTTTSITPEGQTKQTTEETRTSPSGEMSRTTTTTITGMVDAYETGKSITITRSDGSKVTYILSSQTEAPPDLATGKEVTVLLDPSAGVSTPRAKKITYKFKTKENQ
jgi:hypothetical protein